MRRIKNSLLALAILCLLAGTSHAAQILVSSNITVSTTWTADNVYNLQNQIYVMPGATLTIEAGTVIASTTGLGGSLAVTRGGKIFVNGTACSPVIMTSTTDVATWAVDASHPTGRNPKTGTWHEGANEWGNLTLMGKGVISASLAPGNSATPTGTNVKQMEGLTDPVAVYGGNDDNDDSGAIHYLSIRYGGKVLALANELNGLSLGGVGRETDIDHVEIMNNVDDGIEIWGGTVNLKYVNIWNIGDDAFDVDQGWRGKAQFGLIVQGYSVDAAQGSGVGDNIFETDGAENSDAQPITTSTIYNFTVVGQPIAGDHATAWRDNAHMQYCNCTFMELGERLVSFDNLDGDGSQGYGFNGTLTWPNTWTTPYTFTSPVNAGAFTPGAFNDPAVLYTVQTSGTLAEITDSVFYNNLNAAAYTEADARGVRAGANNNVTAAAGVSPIQSISRGPAVTRGTLTLLPVTNINPLPANDALSSVASAPADGVFEPAAYRGGFSPTENWLIGWTAANAYGFVNAPTIPPGGQVMVSSNITVSTTWTADKTYNLQGQIYVMPGATLTIEPGTVIASTAGGGGSLAVTRGAKIFVNGTCTNPVIMTSSTDVATWAVDASHPTGRNPKTGTWHEGANEWGNLTIMGKGVISASLAPGNSATPTGTNVKQMEGLTDPVAVYGGNDDNDDSGAIHYLSLRYGGKVLALANELNGLSLGGVGRETDIDHVEIMNNVDDGIEIWGGTVNLKYVNIWNIGDDAFDVDQGWRGKAQFGLIVQGYSVDAAQGSGVGDNIFETDGAENSDAQPITTSTIYNFTVVGQPIAGDHATAWRDNAHMQYRNCTFMELGERLVSFDNLDGDGSQGYGFNGTLTWPNTWTTPYTFTSGVNAGSFTPGAFNDPAVLYTVQTSGTLAEITDSVFYNNLNGAAYTEADARSVRAPANNNVMAAVGISPIQSLSRGAAVTKGTLTLIPVTCINPLPANDALSSVAAAPADGFFEPAKYRGGFSPTENWILGWTAANAYGFVCGSVIGTPTPSPTATPSPTETATPTPIPANDAAVGPDSIPSQVNVGVGGAVQLRMTNTGSATWTQAGGYVLGVVSDPCGLLASSTYPLGPADNIATGQFFDFSFNIQAPATPQSCTIQLQMAQVVSLFGEIYNETIQIVVPTNAVRDWTVFE